MPANSHAGASYSGSQIVGFAEELDFGFGYHSGVHHSLAQFGGLQELLHSGGVVPSADQGEVVRIFAAAINDKTFFSGLFTPGFGEIYHAFPFGVTGDSVTDKDVRHRILS
jgi:hypothetical protein